MVGHVAPEAARGGPLALVRDGDTVTIDIDARSLARRARRGRARAPARGVAAARARRSSTASSRRYRRLVGSASDGAVLGAARCRRSSSRPGVAGSTRVEEIERAASPAPARCSCACSRWASAAPTARSTTASSGSHRAGEERLVIGHELLGVVERDGARLRPRASSSPRPCAARAATASPAPSTRPTRASPATTSSAGSRASHGFARELVAEDAAQLVPHPAPRSGGSACSRSRRRSAPARSATRARSAAGSRGSSAARSCSAAARSGTLTTFLLRLEGIEVWTASLEPANELVEAAGARYVAAAGDAARGARRFDLVVEAAGNAQLMADSLGLPAAERRRLPPRHRRPRAARLGRRPRARASTRSSRTTSLFGSVNARREDWLAGVDGARPRRARGGRTRSRRSCSLRVPLDRFAEAFAERGGKATLRRLGLVEELVEAARERRRAPERRGSRAASRRRTGAALSPASWRIESRSPSRGEDDLGRDA